MPGRKLTWILIAVASNPAVVLSVMSCLLLLLYVSVFFGWGSDQPGGHQKFADFGVSQIAPARQMDQLFKGCRHYITYGANSVPLFNSVACFGGRYELTMQVPVEIESAWSGSMIDEPQFVLVEISEVTISPSGQVGASSSRGLNFGPEEWQRVYDAGGDFNAIGFPLNPNPVANCRIYTAATRR